MPLPALAAHIAPIKEVLAGTRGSGEWTYGQFWGTIRHSLPAIAQRHAVTKGLVKGLTKALYTDNIKTPASASLVVPLIYAACHALHTKTSLYKKNLNNI